MSKFRCRQLDASKPIPIYLQEDIYDSTEFNNVTNRSVPQLPTGMEKEEETEHHLQQAIFHHRVIPVPEVYESESHDDKISFDQLYPPNYKPNRQFIHIHPFSTEHDIPDYDMDSEDEDWLHEHTRKGELLPLMPSQFEEMMDRLEKASGLKAVTLQEAKLLLKDDDDLITAVYDFWLNKRLRLQHTLIPQVKSEKGGNSSTTDPYVAFRKRTEKMQTRKNRKNDETSYEKMLKLRRDLARAITLLDMVKRREKSKRELLHLNIEVHEKRFEMEDFTGAILSEINTQRAALLSHRAAFAPIVPNHQLELEEAEAEALANNLWHKVPSRTAIKGTKRRANDEGRRERRPYKKKKRTASSSHLGRTYSHPVDPFSIFPQGASGCAGEEDVTSASEPEDESTDGYFAFRRNSLVSYLAPQDPVLPDERSSYSLASISRPHEQSIGRCRRRVGRGGRILLDRIPNFDSDPEIKGPSDITNNRVHYHPRVPPLVDASSESEMEDDEASALEDATSLVICAEMLEGPSEGTVTELNVTLPPPPPAPSATAPPDDFPPLIQLEDSGEEPPDPPTKSPPHSKEPPSLPPTSSLSKKLMNLSSIYIRPPSKEATGGFLLANSRNNGNNVLSGTPKLLWAANNSDVATSNRWAANSNSDVATANRWAANNSNSDVVTINSDADVLTNGPSSKPNLKCTKVTPILFNET